ncbi:MAG: hypothetical protein LAO21_16790 [Acidobacteriia bacterium]|nr:hypothetical protein [Terriglobia bacterium]
MNRLVPPGFRPGTGPDIVSVYNAYTRPPTVADFHSQFLPDGCLGDRVSLKRQLHLAGSLVSIDSSF